MDMLQIYEQAEATHSEAVEKLCDAKEAVLEEIKRVLRVTYPESLSPRIKFVTDFSMLPGRQFITPLNDDGVRQCSDIPTGMLNMTDEELEVWRVEDVATKAAKAAKEAYDLNMKKVQNARDVLMEHETTFGSKEYPRELLKWMDDYLRLIKPPPHIVRFQTTEAIIREGGFMEAFNLIKTHVLYTINQPIGEYPGFYGEEPL